MQRAEIGDDLFLEYEIRGVGEPVVLIHGGLCADWFAAFMAEPALAGHRLIRYHRMGYSGSSRVAGRVAIEAQAAHCAALLSALDIGPAHVVGHSSSAAIALQMALDAPDRVRSLVLLETALLAVPSGPFAAEALERFRAGDRAGAVDVWLRGVCGGDYRVVMDRVLPDAVDRAAADADTFFGEELPALRQWQFGPAEAARVRQPALVVLGARSGEVSPTFGQRHALLMSWLPRAESYVLPDATHLLHVQNALGAAEAMTRFFGRHCS
jgi:3-oxoadipate enol-lactonase